MLTDQLWGSTLDHVALDLCAQSLAILVQVSDGEESVRHELRLSGVTDFHFLNAIPGSWSYVELTELRFERESPSGQWRFEMLLWSEDSSMTGRCAAVTVDDVDLV
jgi:hypothetical protein